MATLTRLEAEARARQLTVERYTLDLDLTRGDTVFGSTTTVAFTVREAGDTFVELRPTTLRSALLDGRELDPGSLADGRLPLTGLAEGAHELTVVAEMPYSRTGEGMHRFTDPADGLTYLYTMCCMTEAPKVFAAFDQPDLKAVFEVAVTAPEEWTVLGNGRAIREADRPGRWHVAPTPPISTYLLAVVAGPYHSVTTEHAGLPFGLHTRRSLAAHLDRDAEELFDLTRRCFDRFHEIFDEPYAFDSYDQAFVPEFNAGAMENPGLVTFRDSYVFQSAVTETEREVRGVVVAHEMAHMWFGDLVTLRWWDDVWLNESFAEYLGYQVLHDATDHTPWTEFAVVRKSWGYDADQRPSTHPVAPAPEAVPDTASAWLNFDGISYAKGASALRQLVAWLGEETFLAGINDHFARHRFGNATLADFIDAMARASDRPVHAWADAWLRTSGPDTLAPRTGEGGDDTWRLQLSHHGGRPHRLRLGAYDIDPTRPERVLPRAQYDVELEAADATTEHAFPGGRPDLLIVNDGDLSYAKVRLDERSWATALRTLSSLPDPLSRTVVWTAARDMVRDGELAPFDYLEAARRHLPSESAHVIVSGVLGFAGGALAGRYLPDDRRAEALGLVREITDRLRAGGGGDPTRLLIAARAAIDAADAPDGLLAWWRAGALPGGPELDQDLRWRLLHRLAVLGATDRATIDAEAAADPGATGEKGAARCRAALPDAAAKEAAWADMFDGEDRLSNYLFSATAEGFWHAEQRELLAGYVPRYFPAAAALAQRRGHALAVAAGRACFPHPFTDAATLALGEECLASGAPTPALRRALADELDDLARALRVRATV
ncbi:Membrane alanyl aminopeptidase Metallo peptidase. MEROPS family M01 [Streptomyces zhaozhouensis]|uniref:Aminopeptidase N n=1 Tax=Streptomyces zhaozhouensis TaxID=1300267 RepID=A0A286DIQ1_9ACTN|nr:aminopeptidase N [Streptomyces zhaozhouensis]SOD58510.1 Membrane alanyl aminopeptidase Metallo peptidase. MEROPS family M01 [Streptomyces zhaozhouensis]